MAKNKPAKRQQPKGVMKPQQPKKSNKNANKKKRNEAIENANVAQNNQPPKQIQAVQQKAKVVGTQKAANANKVKNIDKVLQEKLESVPKEETEVQQKPKKQAKKRKALQELNKTVEDIDAVEKQQPMQKPIPAEKSADQKKSKKTTSKTRDELNETVEEVDTDSADKQQPKQEQPDASAATQKKPHTAVKRPAFDDDNEDTTSPEKKLRRNDSKTTQSSMGAGTKQFIINTEVFTVFNKLQGSGLNHPEKYWNDMLKLIKDEKNDETRTATCAYALRRLIRCAGADNKNSAATSISYVYSIIKEVPNLDVLELLNIMKRELHVGSQQKGKENSLAVVGHLLTAMAILRALRYCKPSPEVIAATYPVIINNLKGREYIITMAADILADSFTYVSEKNFESHIWPLLKPVLMKPIAEQKLHLCDLLLGVHLSYPKVLSLKEFESTIWQKEPQYDQLYQIYLDSGVVQSPGVYQRLGKFLGTAVDDLQLNAWREHILTKLPLRHIANKCYVIATLSYVLANYVDRKRNTKSPLELLFTSDAFVSMVLTECSVAKQFKSEENTKALKYLLCDSCRQFEVSLLLSFEHRLKEESTKLVILNQLLKLQPQLDNHVKTPRLTLRLLGMLNEQGQRAMYKFYQRQFISNDEDLMTKGQREHCLNKMHQMLQNCQLSKQENQIEFLFHNAYVHLDQDGKPCTATKAAVFSSQFAERCEDIAFGILVNKIGSSYEQLTAFNEQAQRITDPVFALLNNPENVSHLRVQPVPKMSALWNVTEKARELEKEATKSLSAALRAIALMLRMAMYSKYGSLSNRLLDDVLVCIENALLSKNSSKSIDPTDEDMPTWSEVIIDILLQMLVQNGNHWRTFVFAVSGALIPHFDSSNLDQMLNILDMKTNPLIAAAGDSVNDDENENSQGSDDESDDDDNEAEDEEEDDDDDNDDDDNDNDDSDDSDSEVNDEDKTDAAETDENGDSLLANIREHVREALINDDDNDDASSIDWNNVAEEQGERLNQALANAFKAFTPKSKNKKSGTKQLTKSERIKSTVLLHFRIRVVQLVEQFVMLKPNVKSQLDAMSKVFIVYQTSRADTKLKSLADTSKKVLRNLLNQKISSALADVDKTLILDSLNEFIALEKRKSPQGTTQSLYRQGDLGEWRDKCIAYLISQFNEPTITSHGVWPLLQNLVHEWATQRSSQLSLASFEAIFATQWCGIAALSVCFSSVLCNNLRHFRLIQILKLLLKHARRICNTKDVHKQIEKLQHHLAAFQPKKPDEQDLYKQLMAKLREK